MAGHLLLEGVDLSRAPAGSYIVEIGSVREPSPLPSTLYLNQKAEEYGLRFVTVDYAEPSWDLAKRYVGDRAILDDGKSFLERFSDGIAVLSLDNFDYPGTEGHLTELEQRYGSTYRLRGEVLTWQRSADVHFEQWLAALPKMTSPSWLMVDNTRREHSWSGRLRQPFIGKEERVIPQRSTRGFE